MTATEAAGSLDKPKAQRSPKAKGKLPKKRKPILRWWGIIGGAPFVVRLSIAIVLAVNCAALAFTQLGFARIELADGFTAYVVVLLLPIALAALLLGTLIGAGMGVVAGTLLYAHASTLPLDYYELAFVNPASSIGLLGVTGFMLGILFAFVLRNDPPPVKRVVYLSIICLVASVMFSTGFAIFVFAELVADLARSGVSDLSQAEITSIAQENVTRMVVRLGDVGIQMLLDAVFAAVLCCVADAIVQVHRQRRAVPSIRSVFGVWLLVVVAVAFMITSGLSFISITTDE